MKGREGTVGCEVEGGVMRRVGWRVLGGMDVGVRGAERGIANFNNALSHIKP